jgi:hypothetical protein
MSKLFIAGIAVRDTARKGMKFNRYEDQQCTLCKVWKPFVRKYWPTSMYIVCRKCVYQLESNVKPNRIKHYKPKVTDR